MQFDWVLRSFNTENQSNEQNMAGFRTGCVNALLIIMNRIILMLIRT